MQGEKNIFLSKLPQFYMDNINKFICIASVWIGFTRASHYCVKLFTNMTDIQFTHGNFFQVVERVFAQFQSFLDDPLNKDELIIMKKTILTMGQVGPASEPRFRDECKY